MSNSNPRSSFSVDEMINLK